ncbi:MAG: TRAP transporter large permease [Rhodospirillaceae bacterium]|nr:TRAP transporter large permease [Rhodospirillaceae bacterium]
MPDEVYGVLGLLAVFGLILVRIPVGAALGITGLVGYTVMDGWRNAGLAAGETSSYLVGEDAYGLTVVPLFILMGVVATRSGMSGDLYRAANALFSGLRGALAMGTIGACAGFGAICGSSLATAATMSRVSIPEMRKFGYDEKLATGTVASGGTLGILIPPSVILIFYAIIAEAGVPELFAAALLPGLALAALHVLVIAIIGWVAPGRVPKMPGLALAERLLPLFGLWKIVLLFGIAVGGIYLGVFSPTEAAAVSALTAIAIAVATRTLDWAGFRASLAETVSTTAMLFFIVLGAFLFKEFIVLTQLPKAVTDLFGAGSLHPWLVILLMLAVYLVLGCFLDSLSMILITVPVFLPLAEGIGYDKVWFGIFVVVVAEAGLITPPVGMNIFVIRAQLPDIDLGAVYRGIVPFLFADTALVVLLVLLPGLALWLPGLLY